MPEPFDFDRETPDTEDLTEDWAFLFAQEKTAQSPRARSAPANLPCAGDGGEGDRGAAEGSSPRPSAPDAGINWSDYNFNFDDEFGAPAQARPAPTPQTSSPATGDGFSGVAPPSVPQSRSAGYSIDAMRRLHDAPQSSPAPQCVSSPSLAVGRPDLWPPSRTSSVPQPQYVETPQPQYVETPYGSAPSPQRPVRRRKKHRLLKTLLLLLLCLLLIGGAVLAVLWFTAKQPQTDRPIGARRDGCSTVLLAGTDEEGTRTDTILLLFVDRPNKTMRLLSIPRDTKVNRDNPVPKINGAYGANGLGEQGMDALMDYVQDLIGYRPDGYVLIDLNCFEQLVDRMGGVDFDVPQDMHYEDPAQDLYIDLKAGKQHLNGEQAMWLVRFRSGYALQDMTRMEVQRSFLSEALRQWCSIGRLFRIPGAFRLLQENTLTDLDGSELLWLARSVLLCRGNGLQSEVLPGTNSDQGNGWYFYEDVDAAAALINESFNPYQIGITPDLLHPYGR